MMNKNNGIHKMSNKKLWLPFLGSWGMIEGSLTSVFVLRCAGSEFFWGVSEYGIPFLGSLSGDSFGADSGSDAPESPVGFPQLHSRCIGVSSALVPTAM